MQVHFIDYWMNSKLIRSGWLNLDNEKTSPNRWRLLRESVCSTSLKVKHIHIEFSRLFNALFLLVVSILLNCHPENQALVELPTVRAKYLGSSTLQDGAVNAHSSPIDCPAL